ncbi:hypothetical protein SUGI_1095180 [Cryptomeria japonica]|nr:hypothetical protein SUGI_1095180 [Cryptomeria japonica]
MASATGILAEAYVNTKKTSSEDEKDKEGEAKKVECTCGWAIKAINDKLCMPCKGGKSSRSCALHKPGK